MVPIACQRFAEEKNFLPLPRVEIRTVSSYDLLKPNPTNYI